MRGWEVVIEGFGVLADACEPEHLCYRFTRWGAERTARQFNASHWPWSQGDGGIRARVTFR